MTQESKNKLAAFKKAYGDKAVWQAELSLENMICDIIDIEIKNIQQQLATKNLAKGIAELQ